MLIVLKRLISPDSSRYGPMLTAGAFSIFCTSRVLRNDLVVKSWRGVLCDETSQKIIRREDRVRRYGAHSAARVENQ